MSLLSFGQLETGSAPLLVAAVLIVGVLHTIVPDHWVPITLIARQRGWSKAETAKAALQAGTGHVVTTLVLAGVVWLAGVAVAAKFGHWVDAISSVALVAFGLWIAISSWRDLRGGAHGHSHGAHGHTYNFSHLAGNKSSADVIHGPELQRMFGELGVLELSIFELGQPPRFRLTLAQPDSVEKVAVETRREDGSCRSFAFERRGAFWESLDDIPEPHGFDVNVTVESSDQVHSYQTAFAEHEHHHGEHAHLEHGSAHDHDQAAAKKTSSRTALLLILGSSPMVEGIPAFFAAGKYGVGLIIIMALVFAASTILTYVLLCVYSTASLRRVKFGVVERYGEVLSGVFIMLVGVAFWLFPVL